MAMTAGNRALLIHAIIYVAVNAVLFAINATQAVEPGEARNWWVIWPIAGWGVGLAAHAFGEWAAQNAKEGDLLADPDVRGVAIHLIVYLGVNAMLVTINVTTSPETLWSIWPILGWGIGLAGHAYLAYRAVLKRTLERYATEQEILTQIQLERRAAEIAAVVSESTQEQEPEPQRKPKPAVKPTRKSLKRAPAKTRAKTTARKSTKKPAAKRTSSRASATRKPGASKRAKKTAPAKSKKR